MTKIEDEVDYANLLHHWQSISFKDEENSPNLHVQADIIRTKLGHLSFADKLSSNSLISKSIENYLETYSDLLDVADGGLNNYAEEILKLIEHSKLENDNWKSSLISGNVEKLPCVHRFLDSIPEENIPGHSKLISALNESKNVLYNKYSANSSSSTTLSNPPKRFKQSSELETSTKTELPSFCTAKDQLISDNSKKNKTTNQNLIKKSLGTRRNIGNRFIPPLLHKYDDDSESPKAEVNADENGHLKNIDPRMIEMIENEIMDQGSPVTWEDIAGLDFAKTTIKESIVWPLLRPDLFTGLRSAPKGILLFGPPGTGKTMIGKCIASQSKAVFFCISASSLTSKWVGEGEKMVRALFAVARNRQPAVIFIDEIDSLLTHRSDNEHESSRRIKTEFLVQLDGATTSTEDRVLVVGATNRPGELDEAARRRLVKKLFIPLPDSTARSKIIKHLLNQHANTLTDQQAIEISDKTDGYSGADMTNLCREAALGPIRSVDFADIQSILPHQVRPINFDDFVYALRRVKASVSDGDMEEYVKWNRKFGTEA